MARPKLHKNPRKLNLVIPLDTKRKLYALAMQAGKSMSQLVSDWAEEKAALLPPK
ncbi:MAG: hypothetical protein RLY20_2953 [Verrucomicrobiota bacterium]|jgi:hypothetical protein